MYKLGFAEKFYTLWDVNERDGNIYYDYIKNVSFDEDKAKSLYPDAEVDMSLRGSKSFVVSSGDSVDNGCFKYGQYKGERFADCSATSYMLWYAGNGGDCEELRSVLEERGYVYYNGSYISKEEYSDAMQKEKYAQEEYDNVERKLSTGSFTCMSSYGMNDRHDLGYEFCEMCGIDDYSCLELDEVDGMKLENVYVYLVFPEVSRNYYRTLPVLNGKGVVVKGKNLEVRSDTVVRDKDGFHVIVGDFRILKK